MITKNIEERRVAREILNIIEAICFSEEYKDYRISYGSKGEIDLIICTIKSTSPWMQGSHEEHIPLIKPISSLWLRPSKESVLSALAIDKQKYQEPVC